LASDICASTVIYGCSALGVEPRKATTPAAAPADPSRPEEPVVGPARFQSGPVGSHLKVDGTTLFLPTTS